MIARVGVLLFLFSMIAMQTHGGVYTTTRVWPLRTIPVVLLDRNVVPRAQRNAIPDMNQQIREALAVWNDPALPLPIEFLVAAAPPQSPYIQFAVSSPSGDEVPDCPPGILGGYAPIGYDSKENRHLICLGPQFRAGVVVHELGHVVGLGHEHQRCDRDRYMKMQPWSLEVARAQGVDSVAKNVSKYDCLSFVNPQQEAMNDEYGYDPFSVMHYEGAKQFGSNVVVSLFELTRLGCETQSFLESRNPGKSLRFEDFSKLSEGDRHTICKLYPPDPAAVPAGCVIVPPGLPPPDPGGCASAPVN